MPSDPSSPLLFDQNSVRHVLERMRQAEPLGDTPLRRLVWVRQQIHAQGPHSSRAGLELALATTLTTLIVEKLVGEADDTREASLTALKQDFSCNNVALEAWSLLYYRYVRIDLNLQVQDIVHTLSSYPRFVNRRLTYGYHRLTEELSLLEAEARTNNRRLWLKMKLPPPGYASLFGVDGMITRLLALLNAPAPPHIIALVGPGGIGKTTLAHAVASQIIDLDRFDDLAWLVLDAPTSYPSLLGMLARGLGYLHLASSNHLELEASLRERFAASQVLIVLDNADLLETPDQVLPRLEALIAPGRVLLTDRSQPALGATLHTVPVIALNATASEALLMDYARMRHIRQVTSMSSSELNAVIAAVGGNPLAARMVVSHLAFLPLDRILEQLPSLSTPGGEPLFDYLYRQSWDALSQPAQQTLLALSLTIPDGIEWSDLQMITALVPSDLDEALVNLINASLVDTAEMPPRYAIHSLTRRFAHQQSETPAWSTIYREMLSRASADASHLAHLDGASQADASHAVMLLRHQVELAEPADHIAERVMQIYPAARRSGQWEAWQVVLRYVIDQPVRTPENRPIIARALIELGIAHRWLGESESALTAFDESITLLGEQGEFAEQGDALLEKGLLYETLNRTGDAYEAYQRAAAAAKRWHNPLIRRRALIGLAGLMLHNGNEADALNLLQEALSTLDEGEADGALFSQLGAVLVRLGRIEEGIATHLQALETLQEGGDLPRLARAHLRIGTAYHAAGQFDHAHDQLQSGLQLMRVLGDSFAQARLMTNLGTLYADQDLWREALGAWRDALALQGYLNDEGGMAATLYNIGDLEWRFGRAEEALPYMIEAHKLAQRLNIVTLLEHIAAHPLNIPTTT